METTVFGDFETFAASLQHVDSRVMLTHDHGQRWRMQQACLNRVCIKYGLEGGGIICEGATRPGFAALFVPMRNPAAIACNGSVCDDHCWILQLPGGEFCHNIMAPNEWVSVFIPLDIWMSLASGTAETSANRLVRSSPALMAKFRDVVWGIMAMDHRNSRFLEIPSIRDSIEAELLWAIVSMVSVDKKCPSVNSGRPVIPRGEAVRTAKNLLVERPDNRLATGRLAAAAGVSERTLRNIFHDYYGVAPLRYLKLRQLHLVRNALKHAVPERDTVTAIVAHFGVTQLGRFTNDYRRLFGESPSQTLCG